jgi:protein transport protein DSL1/ZW10
MFIYNDSNRLCDQLSIFLKERPTELSSRLRLEADIKALENFGKRAYTREMESQKTILHDFLEAAQGFTNCTISPFAEDCESAISMTVDRIRDVNRSWESILSPSARLQSVGSLIATITQKMIVDIEDMGDISEEESQRLRHFCDEVSQLKDIFATAPDPSGSAGDMTGIYVPNWFKFQYLSEILEGSLADIKYLWAEGELKLEFEAEELIDLIEALFAESEHRRKAIGEIRRTSVVL